MAGFSDYLKDATEAFGSVYGTINRPRTTPASDPNTVARAQVEQSNVLIKYVLIGAAAFVAVVVLISIVGRK